ncbi:hypothetical protein SDC9_157295 [bioreactor metagenome]|uniref:Uncharacterized protein n=1 Tax=bioreactor metagenome TaxID=1076179 RepID=A0A645F8X0_9ZZZZ
MSAYAVTIGAIAFWYCSFVSFPLDGAGVEGAGVEGAGADGTA